MPSAQRARSPKPEEDKNENEERRSPMECPESKSWPSASELGLEVDTRGAAK